MARVESLKLRLIERPSKHGKVEGTYSVVEVDGEKMLQIDTYGASDRQIPGKISQSLQFGKEGIQTLRNLLEEFD
ncbi:hypothetical protein [Paracoccus benzoatiresistens]|uniref:Uncharacterized protein n=1 Tax=Paracoccus benzoatiresistens TaxID=2997341 RepID=A0ABT4J788_9RHOB|nr:hypothetical protein [Paracoccus sp. EF6]MCZ0962989.1 hypothetical protein [Paracoccus sp. EF6]